MLFGTDHPFFPPLKETDKWKSVMENLEAIESVEGWGEPTVELAFAAKVCVAVLRAVAVVRVPVEVVAYALVGSTLLRPARTLGPSLDTNRLAMTEGVVDA